MDMKDRGIMEATPLEQARSGLMDVARYVQTLDPPNYATEQLYFAIKRTLTALVAAVEELEAQR